MHPFRQRAVDEIGLLPDLARARSPHRILDVHEVAGEKDPGRESGIQTPRSKDRSVIEAVNGAPVVSVLKHGHHHVHGSGRFQFDMNSAPSIDQAENFSEIGGIDSAPNLAHVQRRNHVALVARQDRIVMNDGDAVPRQMYVELDALNTDFEGPRERSQRVLRSFAVRSSVRDDSEWQPHIRPGREA
jgi:hypothetical protein